MQYFQILYIAHEQGGVGYSACTLVHCCFNAAAGIKDTSKSSKPLKMQMRTTLVLILK